MKNQVIKRSLLLLGLVSCGAAAHAVVTFNFNSIVTSSGTPGGSAPWATLTITNGAVNTVNLALTHNASSASGQFLTELLLNIDPFPGSPAYVGSSPKVSSTSFSQDGHNDAGGSFDFQMKFVTSNAGGGANRLKPGETVNWSITGTGIDESHFLANSTGGLNVPALLHLQGIAGGGSAKLTQAVPEPGTMAALGLGAMALISRRRKKASK